MEKAWRSEENDPRPAATPAHTAIQKADYYDLICEEGRTVLTHVHPGPGAATALRSRLAELGISERDVADAVRWARQE